MCLKVIAKALSVILYQLRKKLGVTIFIPIIKSTAHSDYTHSSIASKTSKQDRPFQLNMLSCVFGELVIVTVDKKYVFFLLFIFLNQLLKLI